MPRGLLPVLGVTTPTVEQRSWRSHALACVAVAGAIAVTAFVPALAHRSTFLLAFLVVVIAAWTAGWRVGVTAGAAALLLSALLLVPPVGSLIPENGDDLFRLLTFTTAAGAVLLFARASQIATEQARQTEALYRLVVDNGPVLVAGADDRGRTVVFNRACEQLTGYKRAEVIGKPFVETFVPAAWRDRVIARFRDEPMEQLARPHHNPWVTKGSTERLIEWRCFRVLGPEGSPITVGVGQDVTDREDAQERLRVSLQRESEALAASQTANQQKERFIALLAHELRGPLNAARGWLQVWQTENDGPAPRLLAVDRNLQMMQGLIEDVVDFSRAEFGKLTLQRTVIDLTPWLLDLLASARPLADAKPIRLEATVAPDLPTIEADPKRLQQIILNVLGNAIKFTPPGGHVGVSASRSGSDAIQLSITDDGPGISPAQREQVFQAFWQGEPGDGLGLGLALVRRLVLAHGGEVAISIGPTGRGTEVSIILPIRAAEGTTEVAV